MRLLQYQLDQYQLNKFSGKPYSELLKAAIDGTYQAHAHVKRPTADIVLPQLEQYTVGQTLQMFMLTTVLERPPDPHQPLRPARRRSLQEKHGANSGAVTQI